MKRKFIAAACLIVLIMIIMSLLSACGKGEDEIIIIDDENAVIGSTHIEEDKIRDICEFTTLQYTVHLVGEGSKEKNIWKFQLQDYNIYFEYDATFEVGVKIGEIEINEDKKAVTVELSEASVLTSNIDKDSISEMIVCTKKSPHVLKNSSKITNTEINDYVSEAKTCLQEYIEEKKPGFTQAGENARELIENYVEIVSGGTYKVKFKTIKGE